MKKLTISIFILSLLSVNIILFTAAQVNMLQIIIFIGRIFTAI